MESTVYAAAAIGHLESDVVATNSVGNIVKNLALCCVSSILIFAISGWIADSQSILTITAVKYLQILLLIYCFYFPIPVIFVILGVDDLLKLLYFYAVYKKGVWLQNLTK